MPVPGVKFLYVPCSDLAAMRRFYTDLVGLDEVYHSEDDGRLPAISWSVTLTEETFPPAVSRLLAAGVASFGTEPVWRGYWSFPVHDPMGNTVEVTWPAEEGVGWQGANRESTA